MERVEGHESRVASQKPANSMTLSSHRTPLAFSTFDLRPATRDSKLKNDNKRKPPDGYSGILFKMVYERGSQGVVPRTESI